VVIAVIRGMLATGSSQLWHKGTNKKVEILFKISLLNHTATITNLKSFRKGVFAEAFSINYKHLFSGVFLKKAFHYLFTINLRAKLLYVLPGKYFSKVNTNFSIPSSINHQIRHRW